jgi:hypothetical protein
LIIFGCFRFRSEKSVKIYDFDVEGDLGKLYFQSLKIRDFEDLCFPNSKTESFARHKNEVFECFDLSEACKSFVFAAMKGSFIVLGKSSIFLAQNYQKSLIFDVCGAKLRNRKNLKFFHVY